MFKWLKGLFSDTETVKQVVDTGLSILDDVIYTKEEKATEKRKLLDMLIAFMEKTKYMSRARRVLAFLIFGQYMIIVNTTIIGIILNAIWVENMKEILLNPVALLVNIVVGFYFFTGLLKGTGVSTK